MTDFDTSHARAYQRHDTEALRQAFLTAFAETGSVTAAADAAGISRAVHYQWLRGDASYREAFEEARERAADLLEAAAFRRAHQGVEEPVYQGGHLVGTKQVYSDSLAVFLLKGLKPQRYRDRTSIEHSGPQGGPIEIDARQLLLSRLAQLAERVRPPESDSEPDAGAG